MSFVLYPNKNFCSFFYFEYTMTALNPNRFEEFLILTLEKKRILCDFIISSLSALIFSSYASVWTYWTESFHRSGLLEAVPSPSHPYIISSMVHKDAV